MTATLTQPTGVMDIRTIAPRERHPLIFTRFDGLATGGSLPLPLPRPWRAPKPIRAVPAPSAAAEDHQAQR